MKLKILRVMLGVSIFDLLLGLILFAYAFGGGGSENVWRGAMLLTLLGAGGILWCLRARAEAFRAVAP